MWGVGGSRERGMKWETEAIDPSTDTSTYFYAGWFRVIPSVHGPFCAEAPQACNTIKDQKGGYLSFLFLSAQHLHGLSGDWGTWSLADSSRCISSKTLASKLSSNFYISDHCGFYPLGHVLCLLPSIPFLSISSRTSNLLLFCETFSDPPPGQVSDCLFLCSTLRFLPS